MRILHLQRRGIWGHSDEDIRDLVSYMNPDVTLTSELDGEATAQIDSIVRPVIHLDSIEATDSFTVGDHALLVIRDREAVPQLDKAALEAGQPTVVTDLIRKEIDEETFAFTLANVSLVDMLDSYLQDGYHLFSTAIDAGEIQRWNGTAIHGLGTTWSRSGHTIGLVSIGERPSYEFLPAERVGLLAIPGMGRRFSMQLKNHGIHDRNALCRQHPRDMMQHPGIGPYRSTKWVSSAKALEEDTVYRIKRNDLAGQHRLFVDIETDSLQPSIIWHIGIYDDGTNSYTSLLEKNPDDKARIIHRFLNYLEQAMQPDSCLLAWYGSGFDFIHLDRFIQRYAPDRRDIWTAIEKIDFMYWVKQHAALPCRTSKLDDVSQRLGYERGVKWLTGKDVGAIYASYMASKKDDNDDDDDGGGDAEPSWRQLREYARDDVVSMKYIYDQIRQAPLLYDRDQMEKIYRRPTEG